MFIVSFIIKGVQETFVEWWDKVSCKYEFLSKKFDIQDMHIQPSCIAFQVQETGRFSETLQARLPPLALQALRDKAKLGR